MKMTIVDAIELGLNIIAQDLVFKEHTEKDIINFINRFKFNQPKSKGEK